MADTPGQSNKNVMLMGVLLLLVGVGATFQFLAPQLTDAKSKLATAQSKLAAAQADVTTLTDAKRQLAQAKNQLQQGSNVDFTKVGLVYPQTEDVPGAYLQMETIMSEAPSRRISTPVYQLGIPVADALDGTVHVPVAVAGTGTYADIKAFITRLEQNLRPISLTAVSLSLATAKEGVAATNYTFNAAGYMRAAALSPSYASATK